MTAPEVQAVLDAIADEIEEKGHLQGLFSDGNDRRVCLLVNSSLPTSKRARPLIVNVMKRRTGMTARDALMHWNDTHPTAEVLAMLRGTS